MNDEQTYMWTVAYAADRMEELDEEIGNLRWWQWRRRRQLLASFDVAARDFETSQAQVHRIRDIRRATERIG